MAEHNLHHTISLLTRTPAALNALLRGLPETWTLRNEGENSWSAFDVVGHLIHADRTDWMLRAKTILQFGESRSFEPFDRLGQVRESQGKSLGQPVGWIRPCAVGKPGQTAGTESPARGPRAPGTTSGSRSRYSLRTAGDLGSA
jgi:hypothetical protein